MLLLRKPWDSQPQEVVGVDWGNPLASRIVGGVAIGSGTDVRLARLSGVPVRTVVSDGIAALGSTTGYVTTSGQRGLVGRSAGGTIATHHHTVVIIAHNVGNGFIYDDAGGNTLAIKVESGQLAYRASGATNLFASATPTVPSTGRAVIGLYVGQFGGNQPTVRINGVTHTGSNTTQDSWVAPSYFTWFGSSFFPSANAFVGAGVVALVFSGQLTDAQIDSVGANPWQLFAPRSIWVPVSVGGGSASTITAAAGASTASTLTASSTAASTPTAAAGTATASTVAASSTAATAITSATGAATASTLTGSAVVAGAITAAAGVGTGETLVGTGLTAGASAITPADGTATTSTLTGSSVAASAITPAAGTATGQTLVSAGSISAASMTSASGSSTTATFAASAVAASVAVAAAGVSSAQVIAATAQAVAAITAAAGVTTAATMASPAGALSNAEMRELYEWVKELHRIHGLTSGVDLVVTPTSRTAGAISQTISEAGTTVTVTRP